MALPAVEPVVQDGDASRAPEWVIFEGSPAVRPSARPG